jgi:catechol 2,3-dioxygenase-like lactoylglutathione lyase family enzyme
MSGGDRRTMIDHLSIGVVDLARSVTFYTAVLAPLGLQRLTCFDEPTGTRSASFGRRGQQDANDGLTFWLEERVGATIICPPGFHVCFAAADRVAVQRFHTAGLAQGGGDNGGPGLRPHYDPAYYAAFLIDPDGWRIEAVTFSPV